MLNAVCYRAVDTSNSTISKKKECDVGENTTDVALEHKARLVSTCRFVKSFIERSPTLVLVLLAIVSNRNCCGRLEYVTFA